VPYIIDLQNSATKVEVTASAGTDIPRLSFTKPPDATVQLSLGGPFQTSAAIAPTRTGQDWAGVNGSGVSDLRVYGGIARDLTGTIEGNTGSVAGIAELYRFDAGGKINATIEFVNDSGGANQATIHAASIESSGRIHKTGNGLLRDVSLTGIAGTSNNGSLNGPIECDLGDAQNITIAGHVLAPILVRKGKVTGTISIGGNISVNRLTGNIEPISIRNGIEAMVVLGNVSADLNFADTFLDNSPQGKIGYLEIDGNMSGSIVCRDLSPSTVSSTSGIYVGGDWTGNTTTGQALRIDSGGLHLNQLVLIGGSLSGTIVDSFGGDLPN